MFGSEVKAGYPEGRLIMAVGIYRAVLKDRIKRTPTVESFRFLPEKKIDFLPGQFLRFFFDADNPDNKEVNKYLSFSSAPGKEYVEVTKRLSESEFSRRLKALKPQDEVSLQGPFGNCIFRQGYKKVAFLIGGIGITPVISILEYIVEKRLDTLVHLFYSNRTEEEIAFRKELDAWQGLLSSIKVIHTLTDCPSKSGDCRFGRIEKELVFSNIPDIGETVFYIFGPPKMTEAMRGLFKDTQVRQDMIKTESFIGY